MFQNLQSFNNLVIFPVIGFIFSIIIITPRSVQSPHLHTYYLGNAVFKSHLSFNSKVCRMARRHRRRWRMMLVMGFGEQAGVQESRSQQRCRSSATQYQGTPLICSLPVAVLTFPTGCVPVASFPLAHRASCGIRGVTMSFLASTAFCLAYFA